MAELASFSANPGELCISLSSGGCRLFASLHAKSSSNFNWASVLGGRRLHLLNRTILQTLQVWRLSNTKTGGR